MIYLLIFLWAAKVAKTILFWVYLWQLKEYHLGRIWAHFHTAKGRNLLFNKRFLLKFVSILAIGSCWYAFIPYFNFLPFSISFLKNFSEVFVPFLAFVFFGNALLYSFEFIKIAKDLFLKELKVPILTKKTIVLLLAAFSSQALFLFWFLRQEFDPTLTLFYLLIFDVLTPIIVSAVVFFFQPLAVLSRNRLIGQAKKKRSKFDKLLVIGITGSYGKTSTKEILAVILAEKFKVLKTREHRNSEIGVAQCILQELRPEHEIFICEMAAYNKGGIKLLCDIAKPKIGILTGINEQHLATFGSQENIVKAKFELIDSLPENGTAILNNDNKQIQNEKRKIAGHNPKLKKIRSYSIKERLDVWAENIKVEKDLISFKVFSRDNDNADFRVNLLGAYNVSNILAAVSCAKELGMSLNEIAEACKKVRPLPGAMKLFKTQGINIIDAAYSSNSDGVISHLNYLNSWPGRKAIVMPCLIELGKTAPEVHRRIGTKIGQTCGLAIITSKEHFKEIKTAAMKKGMKEENILFMGDPLEILRRIKRFIKPGDVLLLESRLPKQLINMLIK